jgi:hypothetical protein
MQEQKSPEEQLAKTRETNQKEAEELSDLRQDRISHLPQNSYFGDTQNKEEQIVGGHPIINPDRLPLPEVPAVADLEQSAKVADEINAEGAVQVLPPNANATNVVTVETSENPTLNQ